MNNKIDRRMFLGNLGLAAGFASQVPSLVSAAPDRRLKIGHTGITWREPPQAVHDVAALGYSGYETFGDVLETSGPEGRVQGTSRLQQPAFDLSVLRREPDRCL